MLFVIFCFLRSVCRCACLHAGIEGFHFPFMVLIHDEQKNDTVTYPPCMWRPTEVVIDGVLQEPHHVLGGP